MTIAPTRVWPCVPIKAIVAFSDEAQSVNKLLRELHLQIMAPRMERFTAEIQSAALESASSSREVGAIPVSPLTSNYAIAFVKSLPFEIPDPEIAHEADGEISFDWFGAMGQIFSVTIDQTGRLAYAGRFEGGSKIHGTERFMDSCPQEIVHGVFRLTSPG